MALSSLAADVSGVSQLIKCDIMKPIETVLQTDLSEEVISVLQVVANLALASDSVARKMLSKNLLRSLKFLCAHKNPEVVHVNVFCFSEFLFNSSFSMKLRCFFARFKGLRYCPLGTWLSVWRIVRILLLQKV